MLLGLSVAIALFGCGQKPAEPESPAAAVQIEPVQSNIIIENEGWILHGDWHVPGHMAGKTDIPAVLMLHRAAGNRTEYTELARELAERGIASLALDLRGHGDSTNLGTFGPPYAENRHINQGAYKDITAALEWMSAQSGIAEVRPGVIGASYSGEQAAIAFRQGARPVAAYVMMSPGNFSEDSVAEIDGSGAKWLFVRTTEEGSVSLPFIDEVFEDLAANSKIGETQIYQGAGHATEILQQHPQSVAMIADWLAAALKP
jgi:dienelactone hydrolase